MWIWIAVALVAAIGETLTTDLFLATLAAAALITAPLALFLPVIFTVVIFAALAAAGIGLVRPPLIRALKMDEHGKESLLGGRYLIGREAVVTQTVDSTGGQVRVGQGEFWSARSYLPGEALPAGTRVEIMTIDGLSALVAPAESELTSLPLDTSDEKGTTAW
jgi:membrane protein implicated in regulation of membrane protease activity